MERRQLNTAEICTWLYKWQTKTVDAAAYEGASILMCFEFYISDRH